MLITDAGIAATPTAPRGPLRSLFSWLGLSALADAQDTDNAGPSGLIPSLPSDTERAQAAIDRAMRAARNGDVGSAESFFTAAFALDVSLYPARIDAFWQLDLAGIEAAQRALQSAGRRHDAAALGNEIAYRFGDHPDRRPVRAAS